MTDLKKFIDLQIENIKDYIYNQKELISINNSDNESDIIINGAFLDGINFIYPYIINKMTDIKMEINDEKSYEKPPKELAEFKLEVLKNMRRNIRNRFNPLLDSMQSSKDKEQVQNILMLFDKELIGQIASIRNELPTNFYDNL